jgi:heavy metal sensor kinase
MNKLKQAFSLRLPLRLRLTLWYLVTLAVILFFFVVLLYWQVQHSLVTQMDTTLQLAAAQTLVGITPENGRLVFQNSEMMEEVSRHLDDDAVIYLLAPDGALWAGLGESDELPVQSPVSGFITVADGDDRWRVYTERITVPGNATSGWLQVAQEMELLEESLENLLVQIILGLPLALLLAGFGGFFLAWRALRPIDQVTRTAQLMNASGLSRRIGYTGPADEVGRLAATFDAMLDRLQSAFEHERRFTSDAAHELRTPLTALKGRIGVTLSRPRSTEEYTATLQEMEQQVDRLIRLSNDLLLIARLDQGRQFLQRERVELGDFLSIVIDQVAPLAEAKNVTLCQSIPGRLTVLGDMQLLVRLFLNLLHNAVKYTSPGGQVTVTARSLDEAVAISIHDTGPGIPARHLPHLFKRFYRVEDDRARHYIDNDQSGTGLGLAIAYEVARSHGGALTVQSVPGEGSTFTVRLPGTSS